MAIGNRQEASAAASTKQEAVVSPANISLDELVLRRVGQPTPPLAQEVETPPTEPTEPEQVDAEQEAVAEEGAAEPEGIAEPEAAAEADTDDVLSKLDLDSLSKEQLDKLRDILRSKAVGRYGELTAKRKEAEERAAALEAKLAELTNAAKNPLEKEAPVENNPFADVDSIAGLQEQYEQFRKVEEWADDLLDEHDHAAFDDVIAEQDGKQLTKREVKDYLKKARQAREKFLPARLREIQKAEQAKQVEQALETRAKAELGWFADADSDLRKEYELALKDPTVEELRKKMPEMAVRLPYILAHAINSIATAQGKTAAQQKPAAPKLKPPSNPSENATRGIERDGDKVKKELRELESRFSQSTSVDDFIALRAAQKRLQR